MFARVSIAAAAPMCSKRTFNALPPFACGEESSVLILPRGIPQNVKASFMLSKEVIPVMQKQKGGGNIVFVTSIAAFTPLPGLGAYSISKTALLGLSNVSPMPRILKIPSHRSFG
jgi:NAD(P)-dependent dehydrogenase (short-subunit alcohol dehydrogenase family)